MKDDEFKQLIATLGILATTEELKKKYQRARAEAKELYEHAYSLRVILNLSLTEVVRCTLFTNICSIDALSTGEVVYTFKKFHNWLNQIDDLQFQCTERGFVYDARILDSLRQRFYKEIIMQAPPFELAYAKWVSTEADKRAYDYGMSCLDQSSPILEEILDHFSECERLRFCMGVVNSLKRKLRNKEKIESFRYDFKKLNINQIVAIAFDNERAFDHFSTNLNSYGRFDP